MERVVERVGITVRPMREEDVETVLGIEGVAFTSPWRADTFQKLIGRPDAELWVMEFADEGVIAYSVLWCVLDQAELANIAVLPEHRGKGYAAELLEHMVDICRGRGVETVYLEVRASNDRAAELYEGFGFHEIGVRKNYYEKPKEDARVMRMVL